MVPAGYFTNVFGRSPVKPLQEHIRIVIDCVAQLEPLMAATIAADYDQVDTIQARIADLEHQADAMKKELRHHLPRGLFMPVDRRDLLDVLLMQDNMANQSKDIAGLIRGRRMRIPASMQALFARYVRQCIDTAVCAGDVINELDELVETGFRGRAVKRVEHLIDQLNQAEHDSDAIQVELRRILFDLEDALRATDVMFLYRLIEWIGEVADHAQRVGSRLQLILAH